MSFANMANPEPWTESAACVQHFADDWFPTVGARPTSALAICRGCDVRTECLEYALRMQEDHGIWGGLTEVQRAKIRKQAA